MRIQLRLAALAAAALLAACSSTPVSTPTETRTATPVTPGSTGTPAQPSASTGTAPSSTVATVTLPPHKDAANVLSKERSVYFDFDDFTVKPQFTTLVERHAKYLLDHPALSVRVEGHTDERGSAEYNLALGQRRAESVLRLMKLQGARDTQMEAVSFGKEKPKAAGHDETAWAENRRADIAYR